MSASDFDPSPSRPAPPEAPTPDDLGNQALSEALRSSFVIIRLIMIILVVVFLASGFFIVDPQHKAIILRMGRPVGGEGEGALKGEGLHFAFPKPVDEVVKIPVALSQQADSTVGWYQSVEERAKGAPPPPPQNSLNPDAVSYGLTADSNIVHLLAIAKYQITHPVKFYFDFADAPLFITNALNNALLYAASRFTVDQALTGQTAFRDAVQTRVRDLVQKQDLGVTVVSVDFYASAPIALTNDFARVTKAWADGARTNLEAESYGRKVLGAARSEKESRLKVAESAKTGAVQLLAVESTNFSRLLADYQRDPAFVAQVLQSEKFKSVWTNAALTEVLPNLEGRQLRLHLSGPQQPLMLSTN